MTKEQLKEIALVFRKKKIKPISPEYFKVIKTMFPEIFEPKETPKSFLDKIFTKDLIRKTNSDKFPNSVFYFDGGTFLVEIEKKGEITIAWVNYDKIWKPISEKFGLNHTQIQQILKVRIEEYSKLSDLTPWIDFYKVRLSIEEHFKLRDVTPSAGFSADA